MKKSLVTGLITLGLAAMLSGCGSSSEINVDTATEDVKTIEEYINEPEVTPNSEENIGCYGSYKIESCCRVGGYSI